MNECLGYSKQLDDAHVLLVSFAGVARQNHKRCWAWYRTNSLV